MTFQVEAKITKEAAARLLISNELDVNEYIPFEQAQSVLEELLNMSIASILSVIDSIDCRKHVPVSEVPQFGKIENIAKVPRAFLELRSGGMNYSQLGFYLEPDTNIQLSTLYKFGENHGKGAILTGLASFNDGQIIPSSLTNAFCSWTELSDECEIVRRLYFRLSVIQVLLQLAKNGQVSGYSPIEHLKESTRIRRAGSIKGILKCLRAFGDPELNRRIDNILWE